MVKGNLLSSAFLIGEIANPSRWLLAVHANCSEPKIREAIMLSGSSLSRITLGARPLKGNGDESMKEKFVALGASYAPNW
jgi:hypothetical protein